MEYLILAFAWLTYFFLHSLLASRIFKDKFEKIGIGSQLYRFFYSLLSLLLFLIIYVFSATLRSINIWDANGFDRYLGLMLTAFGLLIVLRSFKRISVSSFVGLKKEISDGLITTGIHSYVRHPIYSGTLLVLIGFVLYSNTIQSLILLASTLVYLPFGIKWEEDKLLALYGENYQKYKSTTPSIIPNFRHPR